jgi:thiamine kinase-like enzyme
MVETLPKVFNPFTALSPSLNLDSLMSLTSSELNSIKSLPCFSVIVELFLLTDGMSHTCVKVTTPEQVFLAKKLNQDTAITEVFSALTCSNTGLSPNVIYHDNEWLVTEFITGTSLAKYELKSSEKISTALILMAKLHQLPPLQNNLSIPTLNTTKSVNRLFTNPASFNEHQKLILEELTEILTLNIKTQQKCSGTSIVLCHGDINYSNILIDNTRKPWLIDFECAHLAPVEFDLSMFIAVNNISTHHISVMVNNYMKLIPSYQLNNKLLTYYLLYSFFINGLWYLDNIHDPKVNNLFRTLAIEQWSAFDKFAFAQSITMPKLADIISK